MEQATESNKSLWCRNVTEKQYQTLKSIREDRQERRKLALDSLLNIDPSGRNWDFLRRYYDYFSVNESCLCEGLVKGRPSGSFNIGRVLGRGKVGEATRLIYNGQASNLVLKSILNVEHKDYLSVNLEIYGNQDLNHYLLGRYYQKHPFKAYVSENSLYPMVVSCRSDDFANQTIQHILLALILGAVDINNYVYQYDAFYCQQSDQSWTGYNITELSPLGDLSGYLEKVPVTCNLMDEIMRQVLLPLRVLKDVEYSFIHADLKAKNVFVSGTDDKPIFKIADYDKASTTWRGVRFYNRGGNLAETGRLVAGSTIGYEPTSDGSHYILPRPELLALALRHSPIPFYTSYDIYSFVYSLLVEPSVWQWFIMQREDCNFVRLVKGLWHLDYDSLVRHLTKLHADYQAQPSADMLANMRSISNANKTFYTEKFRLLIDIEWVYNLYMVEEFAITAMPKEFYENPFHVTNLYKPCVTPCENYDYTSSPQGYLSKDRQFINWDDTNFYITSLAPNYITACKTYPYSRLNKQFNWDYCKS